MTSVRSSTARSDAKSVASMAESAERDAKNMLQRFLTGGGASTTSAAALSQHAPLAPSHQLSRQPSAASHVPSWQAPHSQATASSHHTVSVAPSQQRMLSAAASHHSYASQARSGTAVSAVSSHRPAVRTPLDASAAEDRAPAPAPKKAAQKKKVAPRSKAKRAAEAAAAAAAAAAEDSDETGDAEWHQAFTASAGGVPAVDVAAPAGVYPLAADAVAAADSPRILSLSPLLQDAALLEQHVSAQEEAERSAHEHQRAQYEALQREAEMQASTQAAAAAQMRSIARDEEVMKELQTVRQAAEHLKMRVHEQQYEIRTLRDRLRLFGEATERDGQDAFAVVLQQLADGERTVAELRASVDARERTIEGLRQAAHGGGDAAGSVAELEGRLEELKHRNAVLEAENAVMREERRTGARGDTAQGRIAELQHMNQILKTKSDQKQASLADMEKLIRLHLNIRGNANENQLLQYMSGDASPATAKVTPFHVERMM
eukprot:Rhum_TRINITY_DN563_c0_g1::Rhum_TRINITY_DN563_c0_g1_i1::g.1777::m.1777